MREILFRGKTYSGRFAYGSLILAYQHCYILEDEKNVHPIDYPYLDGVMGAFDGKATPVNPETVDQFTGKFDKNYRKIFEGDIVRAMMDFGPAGMLQNVVSISWDNSVGGWNWGYFDMSTIEVIGNIHDDPDLLCLERSNTHA